MPEKTSLSTILESPILSRIIVGIGEASEITGVSARQLRYWESKGIIRSIADTATSNRRYDYPTLEKIVLLKDFLDQGYTLESAAKRLEERIQQLNKTILKLSELAAQVKNDGRKKINGYSFIGRATHAPSQQRFNIYCPVNGDSNELMADAID